MEQVVTLWLGTFKSREDFYKYVYVAYTEDGDSIASQFEQDFDIEYYDRDTVEKDWVETMETDLYVLLEGFSYDNQIIQQFNKPEKSYNSIILVYDFEYKRDIHKIDTQNYSIEMIGSARYDTDI
jgi:hypothetical protein